MIRVKLISKLIWTIEKWTFYPKLRTLYKSNLSSGKSVILDVGSNKGQSIDFFKSFLSDSEIHAFEPNQNLVKLLKGKFSDDDHVIINQLGISNKEGIMVFHENILDETSTLETVNQSSDYLKRKARILGGKDGLIKASYEVEVTSLSRYISDANLTTIDVLKIDVEGHEMEALKGLKPALENGVKPSLIQLEYHKSDMYEKSVSKEMYDAFLIPYGYRTLKTIPHSFGDFEEIIYQLDK